MPRWSQQDAEIVQDIGRMIREGMADGEMNFNDAEFTALQNDLSNTTQLARLSDRLYQEWLRTEPGSPKHGRSARMLLSMLPLCDPHGTHFTRAQRDALTHAALRADQDDPDRRHIAHATAGAVMSHYAMAEVDDRAWDEAVAQFDSARAAAGDAGGTLTSHIEALRSIAISHRGKRHGRLDDIDAGAAGVHRLLDGPGSDSTGLIWGGLLSEARAAVQGLHAVARGDLAGTDRHLATLAEILAASGSEDSNRIGIYMAHEGLRLERNELAQRLGVPPAPPPPGGLLPLAEVRRQAARRPRGQRVSILGQGGVIRCQHGEMADSPHVMAEGLELLRDALGLADERSGSWVRYAPTLGAGTCALINHERVPHRQGTLLAEGIAWLERARELAGGPEHPLWSGIGRSLGQAYRLRAEGVGRARRDDRANGRDAALSALRGFVWSVLLQSGTEHAAEAVGAASEVALEAAAWCLTDNAPAEAVTALDSCRGLMLHAAITSRSVPERLAAAGRKDLAAEWRVASAASPGGGDAAVPSDLRHRVLDQLTDPALRREPQGRLLDPPSLEEIGAALRELGRDALVYLVPAYQRWWLRPGRRGHSHLRGGAAVVVTADGAAHWVPLPRLSEDAGPLRAYEPAVGADRDLGPVTGTDAGAGAGAAGGAAPFREQLDRLCRWAWYAAMREVLEAFTPLRQARRRPPRLVLVPMGPLAVAPWHATWRPEGEARCYALAEADISYAASARLLCEAASRPSTRHGGAALVVGDPLGDLRFAGTVADAVHRAFYPDGAFLGGDAAAPGQVREWLGSPSSAGGCCTWPATPRWPERGRMRAGSGAARIWLWPAGG
jgi:CHAT domain-containing protein